MNLLELWVHTPAAAALGWTLLHSLWEGALVALLLAGALCVLRSGRARYAAACLAMLVLLAGLGVTFETAMTQQRMPSAPAGAIGPDPPELGDGSPAMKIAARFHPADVLPWLAPFWIAGVVFFQLRGMASWLGARRLRATGVCTATPFWQARLDSLAAQVRLSAPVTLLESCLTEVPVVIGYVRPIILMPVGLLAGLPVGQVESILLHELAHIRRHDYLVNLLQIFVESLVFYHPAVWWISGVIRAEREVCCDDRVVAAQGDALAYAAALVALEQNRGAVGEAALAATGGNLMKRVRRLLVQPEGPRATLTPVFAAAILTITAAAALAAWQTTAPVRPPSPPSPAIPPAPVLLAQTRKQGSDPTPQANPYRKWLTEDVAYIITNEERAAFKKLQSNAEFEQFIEQLWLRRDPTPGTVENEFKEEHYRRIAYANEHYGFADLAGWKTDRGRIYITYGPPDEKESHPSGSATKPFPFEQWLYRYIQGVGTNVIVEFDDPTKSGEYRMASDPSAPAANAGATVQQMAAVRQSRSDGATLISVPLAAYGDHRVEVSVRILTTAGRIVQTYQDPIQGPAPIYTKIVPLPAGAYRLEVVVSDLTAGKRAADTIDFDVK